MKKLEPEVRDMEPHSTLTDFGTGLKFYERILLIASDKKFTGTVCCEIGYGQKNEIESLLKQNNLLNYTFLMDYSGIDRILIAAK